MASVYALLKEYPDDSKITTAQLTKLTNLLSDASRGRYSKYMAVTICEAARTSIGSIMPAKFLEMKHTISLIKELDSETEDIEAYINTIMDEIYSPILTIPGINYCMELWLLPKLVILADLIHPTKYLLMPDYRHQPTSQDN